MYGMRLSDKVELSKTKVLRVRLIAGSAFILASVIDMEVAETATSFLANRDKY